METGSTEPIRVPADLAPCRPAKQPTCPKRCEAHVGLIGVAKEAEARAAVYAEAEADKFGRGGSIDLDIIAAILAAAFEDGYKAALESRREPMQVGAHAPTQPN